VETHFFSTNKKSYADLVLGYQWTYFGTLYGQTVNSEGYSAMLKNKLKPAIRSKRRGVVSKTLLLHHDNARPHAAAATIETIQN
jgi:hypothetical protein